MKMSIYRSPLRQQSFRDRVHSPLVILAREQVAVAVHRYGERGMACECLHRLRCEPRFDPARYCEVAQPVPIKPLWRRPAYYRPVIRPDNIESKTRTRSLLPGPSPARQPVRVELFVN